MGEFLDAGSPDMVRLSVAEATAIGERALQRVGYEGGDDRRSPSLRRGRRGVAEVVHRGHW